eukprot:2932081-Alexandrium_andersonii.AAC.1
MLPFSLAPRCRLPHPPAKVRRHERVAANDPRVSPCLLRPARAPCAPLVFAACAWPCAAPYSTAA